MLCKEVFNKRVYAVVPEERRFHPWLKFYCERYFDSIEDALNQISLDYPDGPKYSPVDKRQYDSIAGEYRMVEETPAQKYIYDPSLKEQLEKAEVRGKKVVVLHAGSGYRARMAKELGATEVLGTDISYQEIRIAEDVESMNPQGIEYVVTDSYTEDFLQTIPKSFAGETDIVVGYFALDHAMNRKELDTLRDNILRLLKEGGTFIGMSDNPESIESLPNKYGVVLDFDEKSDTRSEGEPRRVSIFKDGKEVIHFHNFVWKKETLKKIFEETGFKDVELKMPTVSASGLKEKGEDFWKEYTDNPDQVLITAVKK
jgi:SAM-dependent methyltransferase